MELQVIYDGEGLKNNEINIKELSLALLGLDQIFEEANYLVNNNRAKIDIKVKGSFKTGCFKIDFKAYQSLADQAAELFTSNHVAAILTASALFSLVFSGAGSLYALLKFLNGKRADKIFENPDKTFSVFKGETYFVTEEKVIKIYQNYKIRKAFEDLISPIDLPGIDDFGIKSASDKDFIYIKKEQFKSFKYLTSTDEKLTALAPFDTNITIVNLSFKEGNKWYINDGDTSYYVQVEDDEFLKKIDLNEIQFSKGDILKVRIRREQSYNTDEQKIKNSNYIEKVYEHIKPGTNTKLF